MVNRIAALIAYESELYIALKAGPGTRDPPVWWSPPVHALVALKRLSFEDIDQGAGNACA